MRSVKCALLAIGLLLTVIACGEKEIQTAAKSMSKFKAVRIVTDAVNVPFEFGSGTGVQGLDIDLGSEIGKALGFEVKWIKASGYDHLFEILKNGEAEIIISAIAIDPQRFDGFAFSKPYYDSGDVIAHQRSEASTIKDLSGLSGKKVGVAAGRPGDRFMATQRTPAGVTIIKGLLLSEWVKIVRQSLGHGLGSGFLAFLLERKCGMICGCDFIDSLQKFTASPAFVPFHPFGVSLAILNLEWLGFRDGEKNKLWDLWQSSSIILRPQTAPSSRSILRRLQNISGVRNSTHAVSELRKGEARRTVLAG